MATATPISHRREAEQMAPFSPHTVTIKAANPNGDLVVVLVSPCSYEPAAGAGPQTFEEEGGVRDRVYLPAWEPAVAAKSLAILEVGTLTKRFEVSDVLPLEEGPSRTLLILTPWTG
jgi:hypothetical protein